MNRTTFLCSEISGFIQLRGLNSKLNNKYISTDLSINWDNINELFSDCTDDNFIIHEQSLEWIRFKVTLIHQIMYEASNNLREATEKTISDLWLRSTWCNRTEDIQKCFKYFISNNQTCLLKSVLILTSIIERTLGNVYRVGSKTVPFLLKDLLETKYLNCLLGNGAIRLMQMLFGTSRALNIRNIGWHGFFSVNELNQSHVAILFVLIASIGDVVKCLNIHFRPQINNLELKINEITARNKFISLFNFSEDLKKIILTSNSFIGPTHFEFYDTIVCHTAENCNNNCIILLLPLFEHLLRRIFCKVNFCDDRNLTALRKEKYTTLDEIFAQKCDENSNKIYDILSIGAVDLYEDLFSHLLGPRIRDKFSHGEIILSCVPCRLTEMLLNLIVYCIIKTNNYCNLNEVETQNIELLTELEQNFVSYESIYHPNSILKYKVLNAIKDINKLLDIPKPLENELERTEIRIDKYLFDKPINECLKIISSNLSTFISNLKIPTQNRPKEELKLVRKLTQITEKIIDISEQIMSDNADRYQSYLNKTIGSRQINRYDEILQSISVVKDCLNCILHFVAILIQKQFAKKEETFQFDKWIFKFLQTTLSFEDKIQRFSNVKINKWMTVRSLTTDYVNQLNVMLEKITNM